MGSILLKRSQRLDDRIIHALYDGVTGAEGFTRALDLVAERFHCVSSALISTSAHTPAAAFAVATGIFDAAMLERYAEVADLDPAPMAFARMAPGTASTTDRIFPAEVHEGRFVNEFFRPMGLAETLGGLLTASHGRFEMLGLHRGDDRKPFTDDELAEIEGVLPHIRRALQLRRTFLGQQRRSAALEGGFDRMATGIVLIGPEGVATFVNRAALATAARHDGMALDRTGQPLAADLSARRRIAALLTDVLKGGAGGIVSARRENSSRSYIVLVAPAPSTFAAELGVGAGRHALVLIQDPANRPAVPDEIVQVALNLPTGAARLVAALAADDDLRSYAERTGITIHTARFHLRTALERTETRTQAELVRLAVRVLRDLDLRVPGD